MTKIKLYACLCMLVFIGISCETEETSSEQNQVSQEEFSVSPKSSWSRVFKDDFNWSTGLAQWETADRKDYNSNICNYDPNNPKIANLDGKNSLRLRASKNGDEYTSGHVKSLYSFKPETNEEYRVSASIKLIARQGTSYKGFGQTYGAWPAFWTAQEHLWPTKGEIDIVERYSYATYSKSASNLFYGTEPLKNLLGTTMEREFDDTEGWHTYEMYWKNENGNVSVKITVDGIEVANYDNSLNSSLKLENFGPHNIILLLNVGSTPKPAPAYNIFDNSKINLFSYTDMYVDYVYVDKKVLD